MKIVRAPWTSGSFLLYAGTLLALFASASWLQVIAAEHSKGALAGWSVLFWALAELLALRFLTEDRRVVAGLFAVVGLGLWGVMIAAFFRWFDWLSAKGSPFSGFHVGDLALVLLILLAALVDLRIWRFPLLVLPASVLGWFFVTDFVSSGGDWSTVVTLLLGFLFFFGALVLDGSESRPYGFWMHVTAGLLIGGAFLTWWHSSDAEWAGIIIVALVFILVAAAIRRSSYAVLGAIGLVAATGHYALPESIPFFGSASSEPTPWAGPLAYLCLGLFLTVLGMLLYRQRDVELP